MAIISLRRHGDLLSRLKAVLVAPRLNHVFDGGGTRYGYCPEMRFCSNAGSDTCDIDMSKWKKFDAKALGINRSMIPGSSWTVLNILKRQGYDAYLVGGCVRDLLLKKIPKDFDVITTATLQEIRKQFHRCQIIGRRFPICKVHIKGSLIEVSSFKTAAKIAEGKEDFVSSSIPNGCGEEDFIRWKDSLCRDFTVNSLYLDPFKFKIYDYTNGVADVASSKLQTIVPAKLSFKEDCARILRGLRIASRLGLLLSKDVENAFRSLSSSIKSLSKDRLLMELNYMLSYGAAKPSLCLLQKFNLLEIFFPIHAAYLGELDSRRSVWDSSMLMKLFSNLDKLVSCDCPSDCTLWLGLLAFHMTLLNNPQDALVVWAFSSVLYFGEWSKGIEFARKYAGTQVYFVPEILEQTGLKLEDIAERVGRFASLVQESVSTCGYMDTPSEPTSEDQEFPCGYESLQKAFLTKKVVKDALEIFQVLVKDAESYKTDREGFEIDYRLLGKGYLSETRFVLGKIILETMRDGLILREAETEEGQDHLKKVQIEEETVVVDGIEPSTLSNLVAKELCGSKLGDEEGRTTTLSAELEEKVTQGQELTGRKINLSERSVLNERHSVLIDRHNCQKTPKKTTERKSSAHLDCKVKHNSIKQVKVRKRVSLPDAAHRKKQKVVEKCKSAEEGIKKKFSLAKFDVPEPAKVKMGKLVKKQNSEPLLSDLFK